MTSFASPWEGRLDQRFDYISYVGSGASSQVFCTRDCVLNQLASVKVFMDPASMPLHEREVAFLPRLDSPFLQRFISSGYLPSGAPYIALQWLEGQDLGSWFKSHAISLEQALDFVQGAVRGLADLHALGIVHRDIKPTNIFLAQRETGTEPVIIDLGVAIAAHAPMNPNEHRLIGTPSYMSPELASMGAIDITPAIDVYSMCAVLYELLTGRRPHEHHHLPLLLTHILNEPIVPPRAYNAAVPDILEALIMKGLARDPRDRFADGQELLKALTEFRTGSPQAFCPVMPLNYLHLPSAPEEPRTVALLTLKSRGDHLGPERFSELEALVQPLGGELFGGGPEAVVGLFGVERTLGDEVSRALKAGFQIRDRYDLAATVVLARFGGETPLDSALELAHKLQQQPGSTEGVRVDGNTARRARSEFNVVRKKGFSVVLGPAYWRSRAGKTLYGRDREQAFLEGFLEKTAKDGTPGGILLVGEDGMGKSTLCSWLFQLAGDSGYRMCAATAQSENREQTYGVVARLIAARAGITDGHQSRARSALVERFLSRFPQHQRSLRFLLEGADPDPQPLVGEALRWSIWEAVAAVAEADLAIGPLFLMVDNVEQADLMSVKLLAWLLTSARGGLGLIVSTTPAHLAHVRGTLPKDPSPRLLQLSPLSRDDAKALVEETFPEPDPHELKTLIARADGNPLFLEELAHLYRQGGGERTVTRNIQITAQVALDALTSDAMAVAKAAAVLGERGDLAALGAMLPQISLAACRYELEAQRLWLAYPQGHARARTGFRFRHSLTRDAVYQLLTGKARQELHLNAAAYFYQNQDPRRAARHFLCAGEKAQAAKCLLALARQAHQAADSVTTLRLVQKIQKLGLVGSYRSEILYLRAASYTWMGRLALGLDDVREVLAQPGTDARLRARAACLGCLQVRRLSNPEEGLRLANIAISEAETFGDLGLMATGYFHATFAYYDAGSREGMDACREALRALETRDPNLACYRVEADYLVAVVDRRFEDAVELGKKALELNRAKANYPRIGANLANVGLCLRHLGRYQEAHSFLSSARNVYSRQGNKLQLYDATMNEGWVFTLLGRYDDAVKNLEEARRGFLKAGENHFKVVADMLLARTYARMGTPDGFSSAVACLELYPEATHHLVGDIARVLAGMEVYSILDHKEQAAKVAQAALRLLDQAGEGQEFSAELLAYAAWCLDQVSDPQLERTVDRAKAQLTELLSHCTDAASKEGLCTQVRAHRLFLERFS